jgi:UPF0755 protein
MVRRKISRKAHPVVKFTLWFTFIALIFGIIILFRIYKSVFFPSVDPNGNGSMDFYIHSGAQYPEVLAALVNQGIVTDKKAFEWLAKKKNYSAHVNPGRYKIIPKMTNNELLNLLRSGKQTPVRVTFNNVRTVKQLAGIISRQLEPDSLDFLKVFSNSEIMTKFNFNEQTFPAMFIPDSYEFYWNTSAIKFVERMHSEYLIFWAKGRSDKAEKLGLNLIEVSTLASIVDQESQHDEENPVIAGVFLNRIKAGIPLQSDPTIIFAWQDYNIRRVLIKHKTIKSPYNTYISKKIPPGPICIPSINAIDGVLNHEENNYLYFCAKDDFSGYHNFARTLSQHLQNARLYQKALNQRKIFN